MNNKQIGNQFEREFCDLLASRGYWVHFMAPDVRGAQPFDIIAVKTYRAYAFDCKTSAKKIFPFSRLEENQIYAFERWLACGNTEPKIAVKYNGEIYVIGYKELKQKGKVNLDEIRNISF